MLFHVGQRVVCVNVDFSREPFWRRAVRVFPRLNCVYTIRGICEDQGLIGLYLDEIVNPIAFLSGRDCEPAFFLHRFRPTRDTGIAVLNQIRLSVGQKSDRKQREPV